MSFDFSIQVSILLPMFADEIDSGGRPRLKDEHPDRRSTTSSCTVVLAASDKNVSLVGS